MARGFALGAGLERGIPRCDHGTCWEYPGVPHGEKLVLQVLAQLGDEVHALSEERGQEGLRESAPIATDLALHVAHERGPGDPIFDLSDREATGAHLATLVEDEREREAVAPPLGAALIAWDDRRPSGSTH